MPDDPKRLDPDTCAQKAAEARELAECAEADIHRRMLIHISQVWQNISSELKEKQSP
jgi:hypothetical protein